MFIHMVLVSSAISAGVINYPASCIMYSSLIVSDRAIEHYVILL